MLSIFQIIVNVFAAVMAGIIMFIIFCAVAGASDFERKKYIPPKKRSWKVTRWIRCTIGFHKEGFIQRGESHCIRCGKKFEKIEWEDVFVFALLAILSFVLVWIFWG